MIILGIPPIPPPPFFTAFPTRHPRFTPGFQAHLVAGNSEQRFSTSAVTSHSWGMLKIKERSEVFVQQYFWKPKSKSDRLCKDMCYLVCWHIFEDSETWICCSVRSVLVGGLEHFVFPYGMSSFPLTFIFFRGVGIPPTRLLTIINHH